MPPQKQTEKFKNEMEVMPDVQRNCIRMIAIAFLALDCRSAVDFWNKKFEISFGEDREEVVGGLDILAEICVMQVPGARMKDAIFPAYVAGARALTTDSSFEIFGEANAIASQIDRIVQNDGVISKEYRKRRDRVKKRYQENPPQTDPMELLERPLRILASIIVNSDLPYRQLIGLLPTDFVAGIDLEESIYQYLYLKFGTLSAEFEIRNLKRRERDGERRPRKSKNTPEVS